MLEFVSSFLIQQTLKLSSSVLKIVFALRHIYAFLTYNIGINITTFFKDCIKSYLLDRIKIKMFSSIKQWSRQVSLAGCVYSIMI